MGILPWVVVTISEGGMLRALLAVMVQLSFGCLLGGVRDWLAEFRCGNSTLGCGDNIGRWHGKLSEVREEVHRTFGHDFLCENMH